jgi:hypothetical protein
MKIYEVLRWGYWNGRPLLMIGLGVAVAIGGVVLLLLSLNRNRPTGPMGQADYPRHRGYPGAEIHYESARQWKRLRVSGGSLLLLAIVILVVSR